MTNDIPVDWALQLQSAYPARSGVSGWGGMRLMLALRRALMESTWEQIIDGCKRYQAYCQKTGIEGSVFVQKPQKFIEEASYLETFTHQAPEDPKISDARQKEQERWDKALRDGARVNGGEGIKPMPLESVGAFETRIALERTRQRGHRIESTGHTTPTDSRVDELGRRVSHFTERMRIAK